MILAYIYSDVRASSPHGVRVSPTHDVRVSSAHDVISSRQT